MAVLEDYQTRFLQLAIDQGALGFGDFTLKSGRVSPYFFNAGAFNTGASLATLGRCYADAIVALNLSFDMLFGPAYKGIPLVTAVAVALAQHHGLDYPWAFNRKEAKDHGEGGWLVGAPVEGRVLIVDDVVTAGTAIREAAGMLSATKAELSNVMVALDRQERGQGAMSATQETEQILGVSVHSIVGMLDIVAFLEMSNNTVGLREDQLVAMRAYWKNYGVKL